MTLAPAPPGWALLATSEGTKLLALIAQAHASGQSAERIGADLRAQGVAPDTVSAALTQIDLRAQARLKFGDAAAQMLFTRAGLEQATRSAVAQLHARRFAQAGCTRVADLGCGLGTESLALLDAGVTPVPVEIDQLTALFAEHNTGVTVSVADAEAFDLTGCDASFVDPARRTAGHSDTRRLTSSADYSPSLSFVFGLAERMPVGVKLGPGFDKDRIPEAAEAQWVSVDGSLVETALWFGRVARPDIARSALVMSNGLTHELTAATSEETEVSAELRALEEFVYEPDPAVIRSGLIAQLAHCLDAGLVSDRIAYLTSGSHSPTPFAQAFRVLETLPMREKELKKALRSRDIGALEVKKRGVDVDPAALRRRLALSGRSSATIIMTRVNDKHTTLLVERVPTNK